MANRSTSYPEDVLLNFLAALLRDALLPRLMSGEVRLMKMEKN